MNGSIIKSEINVYASGKEGAALGITGNVTIDQCDIQFNFDGKGNGIIKEADGIIVN